jgi:Na+-transporting NADH:ubiquinone oxidoreductase subunit NqrD
MRNCLYMGKATQFLKREARTEVFLDATGASLSWKTMRDREFVNRFCAFKVLGPETYHRDDMDDFLVYRLRIT